MSDYVQKAYYHALICNDMHALTEGHDEFLFFFDMKFSLAGADCHKNMLAIFSPKPVRMME